MRDLIQQHAGLWLAAGGLGIGLAFGFIVYRTNFCTMGSISDLVSFGDWRRFRAWLLAAAVAIVGAQMLDWTGVVALDKSMYLGRNLNWLGHIAGGLLFGYGMVFAGGCASRNLARVGGGDLRSLLTLVVLGLTAYMAIGGILGPARNWLEQATSVNLGAAHLASQGLGELAGKLTGLGSRPGALLVTLIVAGGLAAFCFADREFRSSPIHILSGVGVGLCAVAGWAVTGLAFDELADKPTTPISLTYVRPTGDTLEWLQRFTAAPMPGFGVATVLGAVLGAFLAAWSMGRFQLTTFSDVGDTRRSLFGAVLMGIGGVMALGCTIGQAVTGISTLAIGSLLTSVSIVAGGVVGMRRLEAILMKEA